MVRTDVVCTVRLPISHTAHTRGWGTTARGKGLSRCHYLPLYASNVAMPCHKEATAPTFRRQKTAAISPACACHCRIGDTCHIHCPHAHTPLPSPGSFWKHARHEHLNSVKRAFLRRRCGPQRRLGILFSSRHARPLSVRCMTVACLFSLLALSCAARHICALATLHRRARGAALSLVPRHAECATASPCNLSVLARNERLGRAASTKDGTRRQMVGAGLHAHFAANVARKWRAAYVRARLRSARRAF